MPITCRGRVTGCVLAAIVVSLFVLAPAYAQEQKSERATLRPLCRQHLPASYERWIDQDVRWIITPRETAEFCRMSGDTARNDFIQKFWLRRDPTPGTATNEFKEEHYRRLAFADQHFAGETAGRQTDRGRIYIRNGPPDQIMTGMESGPGGAKAPEQVWHYRSGPKTATSPEFKFVDACNCGDYQLQSTSRK